MQDSFQDTFIVSSDASGTSRLDSLLTAYYPHCSRSYFQYLIGEGQVLVNDRVAKKSLVVTPGDEIEVRFILTKEIGLEPENIPLDILFEDETLIAINKPPGFVVHPAPGNWSGTFVNALLYHCKTIERDESLRPGIVHRLDKDTSGVLIAAKTRTMHQALTDLFSSRQIEKRYSALCRGKPTVSTIVAPIARHPIHRKQMSISPSGRHAVTHLEVVATNDKISLLDIRLETGRTHQIRVHLQHIGHPLLGDSVYGTMEYNERLGISRQMLHARTLSFIHPLTKESLLIEAPLPRDFTTIIERLIR